MIAAIVAVDLDWGIGYNGDLLEHIPADLQYFKEKTSGHPVVMGRRTWDSLPKKPLPNRLNLVVDYVSADLGENVIVGTYDEIKTKLLELSYEGTVFVIGGGMMYKELLPLCDKVYVTKIYKKHEDIDTYFPNLDMMPEWKPKAVSNSFVYNDLPYQFWEYNRFN